MIIEELIGTDLIKRYSDQGVCIRQIETGNIYSEAIDLRAAPYTYEETDIPIEPDDLDEPESPEE